MKLHLFLSFRLAAALLVFAGLSVSRAPAQTAVATLTAGAAPECVAVNPVTNMIYVVNSPETGLGSVTAINGANDTTATVTVGNAPSAVAVNPVTNMIYVTNYTSDGVSVINGATNTVSATVPAEAGPTAIAVNPVTNMIYVANYGAGTVTVINGATNAASTVTVGAFPIAVAVNPVTNTIYVANNNTAGTVSVINGTTNAVSATVNAGTDPYAVAVNPVTNTIYIANSQSGNVTVINGATNAASSVTVGTSPAAVAVNPLTNLIYVANSGSSNVSVINGVTNAVTATVSAGSGPQAVAVDPLTNRIYVANYSSANVTVINGGTNTASTVIAGTNPFAVALNPVTNKIYVANEDSNNVTVIDGVANATTTVAPGTSPAAVAVNPVTNQIYAANGAGNSLTVVDGAGNVTSAVNVGAPSSAVALNPVTNLIYVTHTAAGSVTVLNGATNAVATIAAGTSPTAIAVNPVTNMIYVANSGSSNVTVINGATNATVPVAAGTNPIAIAVNPATNMIYVANSGSSNVTVINGATNAASTVSTGAGSIPQAIAVNPVTNMIYIANNIGSGTVTVLNGATNATSTVAVGADPQGLAVNPVTNEIYVSNFQSANVSVINGAANTVSATVSAGAGPYAVAVNSATNMIYVTNLSASTVTVIDGATHTALAAAAAGSTPEAIAVNPATGQVYVANSGANGLTVITPAPAIPVATGLFTAITPLPGNVTYSATPAFSFLTTSLYGPIPPPPDAILYQVDTTAGPWQLLTPVGGFASATLATPLARGPHTLFAFATDGQETAVVAEGTSPITGAVSAYSFVYGDATPVAAAQSVTLVKGSFTQITLSGSGVNSLTYNLVTLPAHGTFTGTAPNLTYSTSNNSYIGTDSFTFIVNDGVQNSAPATVTVNIIDDTPVANSQSLSTGHAIPLAVTLTGSALNALTYNVITPPANGQLSGTAPLLTYTPNIAFAGNDSFTFEVNDGFQNSVPATITIAVVETAPVATPKTVTLLKGTSTPVILAGSSANPLTYAVAAQPAHGTLGGSAPNLTYTTSNASYIGPDSFTFTVNDGLENSAAATVSIEITDDTPVANGQSLGTSRGAPVAITLTGTALDALTYRVVTSPANGMLSGTAPQLIYSPNAAFVGNDTFTFEVNDGYQNSAAATVTIAVVETGAPVATAQSVTVERGSTQPITLGGASNFALTYAIATQPTYGTLGGSAPSLDYTAGASYAGSDSFTFTVSDGVETSPPATVSISILDSPPVAVNEVFYTAGDSLAPLTLDVLANDSDPEGRTLTITAVSRASEGRVAIAAGNLSLTYQPEVLFAASSRPDIFTYTITNGDKTATAEVTVINPFFRHQGAFDGLLTNGVQNAGYLTLTLSGPGSFTGSLNLDGVVSPFHSAFSSAGSASIPVKRKAPLAGVTLQLQFDEVTGDAITASVTDGAAAYAGALAPQVAISTENPLAQAGRYTVLLPSPTPASNSLPGGDGYAIMNVTPAGVVSLTGVLGDATPFSCSGYLKTDGTFPIYVALNAKAVPGSLWGVAAFQDVPDVSDLAATLQWNKAAQPSNALYHAGFSTPVTLLGSYYTVAKGVQALAFSNPGNGSAQVFLSGGNLAASSQQTAFVSATNVVKAAPPNIDQLKLAVTGKTGLMTGSFLLSASAKSPISGVVFQKQNIAEGLFTGLTLTGSFTLEPQ